MEVQLFRVSFSTNNWEEDYGFYHASGKYTNFQTRYEFEEVQDIELIDEEVINLTGTGNKAITIELFLESYVENKLDPYDEDAYFDVDVYGYYEEEQFYTVGEYI